MSTFSTLLYPSLIRVKNIKKYILPIEKPSKKPKEVFKSESSKKPLILLLLAHSTSLGEKNKKKTSTLGDSLSVEYPVTELFFEKEKNTELLINDPYLLEKSQEILIKVINQLPVEHFSWIYLSFDPEDLSCEEKMMHKINSMKNLFWIITFGARAFKWLYPQSGAFQEEQGKIKSLQLNERNIPTCALFHPDMISLNPQLKTNTWTTLQSLQKALIAH